MKKIFLILSTIVALGALNQLKADLPEGWFDQLKRISNAAEVINTALSQDASYYQTVQDKVNEIKPVFDSMNDEQSAILSCIKSRFADMKKELSQCQSDTDIFIENAKIEIVTLKSDLEGLRERTTKEISDLTHDKTVIENQLADLTTEYNEDTAEMTDAANDTLETLKETIEKYNNTIKERNEFIESVDALIEMLDQDISGDTSAWVDLRKEVC